MWGLGQDTLHWVLLLVYVPQATLYWVMLLVYVGPRATLYWVLLLVILRLGQHTLLAIVVGLRGASDNTLYLVLLWVMGGFGQHTLLGIISSDVGRLHQWVQHIFFFLNNCRNVEVLVSVSPPKLLYCFQINLYKRATIRQISYSQTCTFPQTVLRTGICLYLIKVYQPGHVGGFQSHVHEMYSLTLWNIEVDQQ
jgi:hypothetical protein